MPTATAADAELAFKARRGQTTAEGPNVVC